MNFNMYVMRYFSTGGCFTLIFQSSPLSSCPRAAAVIVLSLSHCLLPLAYSRWTEGSADWPVSSLIGHLPSLVCLSFAAHTQPLPSSLPDLRQCLMPSLVPLEREARSRA